MRKSGAGLRETSSPWKNMHSTNRPNAYSGTASSMCRMPRSSVSWSVSRYCRPAVISTASAAASGPYQERRYQPLPSKHRMKLTR